MGDAKKDDLRVGFDRRLNLKFVGSQVTTDAGLLAFRELDEALGLTDSGAAEPARCPTRPEPSARPAAALAAFGL